MNIILEIVIIILIIIIALHLINLIFKHVIITGGNGYKKAYQPESFVLIFCHNRPVLPNLNDGGQSLKENNPKLNWYHWLRDFMNEQIISKNLYHIQTETVDLLPQKAATITFPPPPIFPYVHHQADGISDDFILKYHDKYDIIFALDCGFKQILGNETDPQKHFEVILRILKLLKSGGWLFYSKTFGTENVIQQKLQQIGIHSEVFQTMHTTEHTYPEPYLKIVKP